MSANLNKVRELAAGGRLEEALVDCEAQLLGDPANLAALDLKASLAHRGGNPTLALDAIRRIASLCPHLPGPRASSAMLLESIGRGFLGQGNAEAAFRAFSRAIHANPDSLTAHNSLIITLHQSGRAEEAAAAARKAIARHPAVAEFHMNLSVILFESGRMEEAAAASMRLIALVPESSQAHSTLGQIHFNRGAWTLSRSAFEHAAALDPEDVRAHLGLYYLGEAQGDHEFSARHQAEALKRQQVFSEAARNGAKAPSILVLESPGNFQANLPTGFFLSAERYHLHRYVLVEGMKLRSPDQLPPYDIVFNAVSEPDRTTAALGLAAAFIDSQDKPCLNQPRAVSATARDRTAQILDGIEGLIIPEMRRVARGELLSRAGAMGFPVLLRPVGSHAGDDLEKLESPDEVEAYLKGLDATVFYLSRFTDFSSPDGLFRKYRAIIVDGEPYPCHMAIRDHWMIHYFNAHMELSAAKRAEEERFLADPEAALGSAAWNILREIGGRMGLDYFGIDFGLSQDGRIVLFEVDVAAIVHLMDDKTLFAYKHRHVPRIFEAAHAMIAKRLRSPDSARNDFRPAHAKV